MPKKCKCGFTRPNFNYESEKTAICCSKCKENGMVNINQKKCKCGIAQPNFNYKNKKIAICCTKCKENGMVNIISRKCKCGLAQPLFNYTTEKIAICCSKCKEDGMTNIIDKKCYCGKKRPNFGFETDKIATRCNDCKEDGMVDIKNKKCICGKRQPHFGHETDKKATRCNECKEDGMIDIRSKKCLSNETHNISCPTRSNKYYNGYCTHCFANLFPSHPKTTKIRSKSKELKVVNYIVTKYNGFLHDKPLYIDLKGGCCPSKRRIDLRILIGNTLLCIEIDEHQHRGYDQIDEIRRYNNLYMDFSGKYIFIRYNPDKYKKDGKVYNPTFNTRMMELEKEIEKQIERINNEENEELIEIHHMYYDN